MIPLVDLTAQYHSIRAEIDRAVLDVLEAGHFILGPSVEAYEREVAAHLGVKHACGVASGTDALVIALRAVGVGPGHEVIIPAYSFFATAGAVMLVGATPVFVDILPNTFCIDMGQLEAHITQMTRAIIPVHLYGHPAEMAPLLKIAHEHGISVIEDNAQAFGAEYEGRKTGTLGDIGCLSFFPTKNLGGCGDGGMVVTDNENLAGRMRMLRAHGWKRKYYPEILGYNSRLDELQAAILRVKLKYVEGWNIRRREIANLYTESLKGYGIVTPGAMPGCHHVYHLYTLRLQERDRIKAELREAGIASDIYYPLPLHLAGPCLPLGWKPGDFPEAEQASRESLSIPLFPEMSPAQCERVILAIRQVMERARP